MAVAANGDIREYLHRTEEMRDKYPYLSLEFQLCHDLISAALQKHRLEPRAARIFAAVGVGASVLTEICQETGLPRATTFRLLGHLQKIKLIETRQGQTSVLYFRCTTN